MRAQFDTRPLHGEIFRVGRPPSVWRWPDWRLAGADGAFGNRWDDPQGRFRVLYACSQRTGAFVEALAPLRSDPAVAAASDPAGTARHSVVPRDWCQNRLIASGIAEGVDGQFVMVGTASTLRVLRKEMPLELERYGVRDLDCASIRLTVPRALTQEIAAFVYTKADDKGQPFAGIYYRSKHGDDFDNWAIFERERTSKSAPVASLSQDPVDPDDEDFQGALALLGLDLA